MKSVEFNPGVLVVAAPQIEAAAAAASLQGIPVFTLVTGVGGDHGAFFDAVRTTLPLDPPLIGKCSWDALSDSLFGGLYALGAKRVLLIWMDAPEMAAVDQSGINIALEVLADVVAMLADPRYAQDRLCSVTVLLSGSEG
ncbi:barstar family protein [Micromonospora sp. HUAS LYJ1]|uniref:barstar family protein n=1 Tax=Micromonospora sp. HUAS LYJ1 TaxID=3061626 RepID=UPI0026718E91|nr:barstar family protein [Micromonospora sp. HUAS LYJ1]WKU02996.1 barstar family protein [Micromonospora sp. HUAS LYJ1]